MTGWAIFVTGWGHIRDRLVTITSIISRFNAIYDESKSLIEYLYRYSNGGGCSLRLQPLPFVAKEWGVCFV